MCFIKYPQLMSAMSCNPKCISIDPKWSLNPKVGSHYYSTICTQ